MIIIRGQDRKWLVSCSIVWVAQADVYTGWIDGKKVLLGSYNHYDKAMEVMDKIEEHIKLDHVSRGRIFQMPPK